MTSVRSDFIIEHRIEFGAAAHGNRGRYSGQKIHRLHAQFIVGLLPGCSRKGTLGAQFRQSGRPVLFSAGPVCGTTQGQFAGSPISGLTADAVTCSKCLKIDAVKEVR